MSPSSSCSRWSPSPQQVMILEELYRRGVRTPNAFQRQIITAHLSFYGHIHPKNVFYWFQNRKARYRLKLMSKKNPTHQKTIYTQGNGGGDEEVRRAETMKEEQYWKVHDLMMMLETCPCCKNRPLVTLQLFPLTSSK